MRIKKFIAKSMREALIQIKEELGEEAIILKTRKLPKKVFALGAQDEIEVTAGIDENVTTPERVEPLKMNNTPVNTGVYTRPRISNVFDMDQADALDVKTWAPPVNNSEKRSVSTRIKTPNDEIQKDKQQIIDLKNNLDELKGMVKDILVKGTNGFVPPVVNNSFAGTWATIYKRLIDSEVNPGIAGKFITKISGTDLMLADNLIEKKFITAFQEHFPVSGPLKLKKSGPVVIVFVGPTGAGKTTTLAKLAAHCAINKSKKVSIITADTYRIAAIEQIRTFADIVKVGLQIVFSPDEIPDALAACEKDEIVLVDTAGRSQRNAEHMDDLRDLLSTMNPDETHLVLSATTKDSDLLDTVLRYRSVNINRLLFTKLDETAKIGNIFNLVQESEIPVSYFTFGQSVPDDIELAQPSRFVQRMWGAKNGE